MANILNKVKKYLTGKQRGKALEQKFERKSDLHAQFAAMYIADHGKRYKGDKSHEEDPSISPDEYYKKYDQQRLNKGIKDAKRSRSYSMAAHKVRKILNKEDFDGLELVETLLEEGYSLDEISDFIENDFAQVLEEGLIRKVDKALGSPLQKRRIDKKNASGKTNRSSSEIVRKSKNTVHNIDSNTHLTGGWHKRGVRNDIKGSVERQKQLKNRKIALKDLHKFNEEVELTEMDNWYRQNPTKSKSKPKRGPVERANAREIANDPFEASRQIKNFISDKKVNTKALGMKKPKGLSADQRQSSSSSIRDMVEKNPSRAASLLDKLHSKYPKVAKDHNNWPISKKSYDAAASGSYDSESKRTNYRDVSLGHSKKMGGYMKKPLIKESKGYGGGTPEGNKVIDKTLNRIQTDFGPGGRFSTQAVKKRSQEVRHDDPEFQKYLKSRGKSYPRTVKEETISEGKRLNRLGKAIGDEFGLREPREHEKGWGVSKKNNRKDMAKYLAAQTALGATIAGAQAGTKGALAGAAVGAVGGAALRVRDRYKYLKSIGEETLHEACKPGKRVEITGGSLKGKKGVIGEIKHSVSGKKTYTIDYDHGDDGHYKSSYVDRKHFKLFKE